MAATHATGGCRLVDSFLRAGSQSPFFFPHFRPRLKCVSGLWIFHWFSLHLLKNIPIATLCNTLSGTARETVQAHGGTEGSAKGHPAMPQMKKFKFWVLEMCVCGAGQYHSPVHFLMF